MDDRIREHLKRLNNDIEDFKLFREKVIEYLNKNPL